MREELLLVLKQYNSAIDYENENELVTGGLIDSIGLVTLIDSLENTFQIDIPIEEIIPENFESVDAILNLIEKLKETK